MREIDALGGIMGRVIDRTGIQFRLLNRSRGPAVQSPRAQADRALYRTEMRATLESTPNLHLRQGMVVDLLVHNGKILGVVMQDGRRIGAAAVVIAAGTFLNGLVHTGRRSYTAGRIGEPASIELAEALKQLGFPVGRLKTGTPPRLDGRTIDHMTDRSPGRAPARARRHAVPRRKCREVGIRWRRFSKGRRRLISLRARMTIHS